MSKCQVTAKGPMQCTSGILLAACLLGMPGSLCLSTSTAGPDALPHRRRPQQLSFLYSPTFSCQRHFLFTDTAVYSTPPLVYKAVQIKFSPHDSCLWGFEVSAHLLRQSWCLGTGGTCRLHEAERCKHALPCARRIRIYLEQQTRPPVCSVPDSFNLFLTSIPTWEAFSLHIEQYVSAPGLFSH